MHYTPGRGDHGLPHDPLKALVVPRPIGWISSIDERGVVNLAPYSFFNMIADRPAYVMFSSSGRKDSLRNIEVTGEFVCNMATEDLFEKMLASASPYPRGQSEPDQLDIAMRPSAKVQPPTVTAAHAALECVHFRTLNLPGAEDGELSPYRMVIGRVIGVYIDDAMIDEHGLVRADLLRPVSRLGYRDYSVVEDTFSRLIPPLQN